jgi:hypothetical protein
LVAVVEAVSDVAGVERAANEVAEVAYSKNAVIRHICRLKNQSERPVLLEIF